MRVVIRNKAYDLSFVPKLEKTTSDNEPLGLCDSPTTKGKKIRVLSRLRGEKRLSVLIHELLHACYWDMDEEAIHYAADDIARVLWRLGYRADK